MYLNILQKKTEISDVKVGQGLKRHFLSSKGRCTHGLQLCEKLLTIAKYHQVQVENQKELSSQPIKMGLPKRKKISIIFKIVGKMEHFPSLIGLFVKSYILENSLEMHYLSTNSITTSASV